MEKLSDPLSGKQINQVEKIKLLVSLIILIGVGIALTNFLVLRPAGTPDIRNLIAEPIKTNFPEFKLKTLAEGPVSSRVDQPFVIDRLFYGGVYQSEFPPLVKMQPNDQRVYLFPTSLTPKCVGGGNFLTGIVNFKWDTQCGLATKPINTSTEILNNYVWAPIDPATLDLSKWKNMGYDGMFSVHLIDNNTKWVGFRSIEISNNGAFGQTWTYQNMIYPDIKASECGPGTACWWESESAYILMSWQENDPAVGWTSKKLMHDEGPIIWPPKPYREWKYDSKLGKNRWTRNAAAILYHPMSVVGDDGYFYVYYSNLCMKVSRAPVSGGGMPGTWKNYYNGAFTEDSLPAGFTYANIDAFLDKPGNKSSCIFPDDTTDGFGQQSMNVAKVRGTPYYLAVIERYNWSENSNEIAIRISTDLVNWSKPKVIHKRYGGVWATIDYTHPYLIDKKATTNYEIDKDEFYILGIKIGKRSGTEYWQLNKMKLSVDFQIYPPADKAEEIVEQYYKQISGATNVDRSNAEFQNRVSSIKQNGCQAVQNQFFSELGSLSSEELVKRLYRGTVSREPDGQEGGSKWWIAMINAGYLTKDNIIDRLWESSEPSFVCRTGKLYREITPSSTPVPTSTPTSASPTISPAVFKVTPGFVEPPIPLFENGNLSPPPTSVPLSPPGEEKILPSSGGW